MDALETNGQSPHIAKGKNRLKTKSTSKPEAEKMKLTVYVDAELGRRFITHATYTSQDRSSLFAEMIRSHCKRFVVSDRAKSDEAGHE